jgi:hypothetical protein
MSRPTPKPVFALAPHARNGCAQAALAWLLDFWQLPRPPLAELYRAHPPDTPLRLMGTSPPALARMAAARGLRVRARSGGDAHAARAWLAAELAAGRPAALLLDLRHLGRRLPGGHWVVALAADEREVHVTNLVRTPRHAGPVADLPWEALLPAWRCRAAVLPSWRFAGVSAAPRDTTVTP